MEKFNSMGIDNEPYKAVGTYEKEGSKFTITFEADFYIRRFEDFKENKKMIENIGFYGGERSSSFSGPFKVLKIKANEVTLEKYY